MDIETQVSVQIRYTVNGEFTDALYYPVGEVPSSKVQEAEMQRRYEAQQAIVNAPPVVLTPEQQAEHNAAQVEMLKQQFDATKQQILQLMPDDETRFAFIQEREAIIQPELAALTQAIADAKAVIIKEPPIKEPPIIEPPVMVMG